ncbi:YBR077C [Saccharomyces arboricola H-6]|uniref:YBR077C n=1 Tax=Saccharomyces arboricola (strain H-6 / AS 2.3317 / CBS 10644) TaxID=1160507 RepID=J8PRN4_SACAR|nr:YBR077C [Saccharomyces arboricola H-6]
MVMLHSKNVKVFLENTLKPYDLHSVDFKTSSLQSSILLTATNGGIMSFATSNSDVPKNSINEINSVNNLKMMSLLVKDKWSEDENNTVEQPTNSCYPVEIESFKTKIYTYEMEDLHACVAQIPNSDLLLLFIAESTFPYGLLVIKIERAIRELSDLFGYRLG